MCVCELVGSDFFILSIQNKMARMNYRWNSANEPIESLDSHSTFHYGLNISF